MRYRGLSTASTLSAVILSAWLATPAAAQKPLHERKAAAAWTALQKGQLRDAISNADACIREFRGVAARKQAELKNADVVIPLGVVNDRQKKLIFDNGAMNDVATCYYIKGRAAQKLGQVDVAAMALAEAMQYPHARAWDDRGWFWSPAEAAQQFLKDPAAGDKELHELYTADAWAAFNRGDHAQAVALTTKCVEQFQPGALAMQKAISARGVRPPVGAVSDDVKKKVFENGLLNDVATCLFIRGRSAEALGDKDSAVRSYRAAQKLDCGRAWDPNGWFWSPAEASADRLEVILR